ncbi:MAG: monofunctional biosynthetic peptidoglycan transglycosylase [Pseudomonadota bacterium]
MTQYRKTRGAHSARAGRRGQHGKSRRRQPRQRGRGEHLRRILLWSAAAFLLLSLVPVLALRWLPPPTSAVMLARTLSGERQQDYRWVDLEQISADAALAVVAAEDQKFPAHFGFDLDAIRTAVNDRARGARLRGASTLTQQVARNLFLWQGRSFVRKGLEAWLTLLLEALWPKHRILEVYLNIAETGTGLFGIEAAAQRYFGIPAYALGPAQAALIAAVLPNPHRFHVDRPSAYVLERRDHILGQMELLGGTGYLRGIL